MSLHLIEVKIQALREAEETAWKQRDAVFDREEFVLALVPKTEIPSNAVPIDSLADKTVWDTLQRRAEEELAAERRAIEIFKAKVNG